MSKFSFEEMGAVTVSFAAVLPFRSSLSGLLTVISPAFASSFTVPPSAAAMAAAAVG